MAKVNGAKSIGGLALLRRIVRVAAIVVGAVCTFVTLSSLVGLATANGWVHLAVALVLTVALPAFAVDRALPKPSSDKKGDKKGSGKPPPGLAGDVAALVLLGIGLLFIGIGQPVTRPLLVREGDRYAEGGHEVLAHAVYLLAGVRPVDAPPPVPTTAPSTSPGPSLNPGPNPGASQSPGPGPSVSASTSPGPSPSPNGGN
jgi:hypothetical protein